MSNANQILTPELTNYAKKIVAERGITQDDMNKKIMGEILLEAMRRMDRAISRIIESKSGMEAMAAGIYFNKKIG